MGKVPDGCLFTVVLDSCHSGGMIERTKEQIGNSTRHNNKAHHEQVETRPRFGTALLRIFQGVFESLGIHLPRRGYRQSSHSQGEGPEQDARAEVTQRAAIRSRSLPLSAFIRMLKEKTGKDDVDVGSIRATLFQHFGDDASPKVKRFVKAVAGTRASEYEARGTREAYAGTPARLPVPRNGVLVSGCQTDQTAGDATTPDGVSYGLLSDAIQTVLARKKEGAVTNRELVLRARELLAKQGVPQQPGLYCSDTHANAPFIC